jgi:hypothetical protein
MAYKSLKKDRRVLQDKKTGELSVVQIPLVPMTYYWQFLKLLTELEDNKEKIWIHSFGGKKLVKQSSGSFNRNRRGTKVEVKVKINKSAFKMIDLDYFRKQPSLLNAKMIQSGKEKGGFVSRKFMNIARKWYQDNIHLIQDHSVKLITSPDELDSDKNYFTVQIPKSLNKLDIRRQLEQITDYHNLLDTKSKTKVITFEKLLSHQNFDRLFRCFILKHQCWTNREVSDALGYKIKNIQIPSFNRQGKKYMKTAKGSVGTVLRCYQSAQHLLYNLMTKNVFPKTTLD